MRHATEQTPEQSFHATRQVYTLTSWPSELISTEEVRTPPQSASQLTSVGGVTAHFSRRLYSVMCYFGVGLSTYHACIGPMLRRHSFNQFASSTEQTPEIAAHACSTPTRSATEQTPLFEYILSPSLYMQGLRDVLQARFVQHLGRIQFAFCL